MPIKIISKASNKPQKPAVEVSQSAPKPFIDKISIVIFPLNEEDRKDIQAAMYAAIEDKETFHPAKRSSGFRVSRHIAINCLVMRPYLQFNSFKDDGPSCRLEFNPSELGDKGLAHLHSVLTQVLPNGWDYVYDNGRISRIDIAVDLPGERMGNFIYMDASGATSQQWGRDGKLETYYLGKPHGNQTRIYSKKKEQIAKNKNWNTESVVRVERTLRNQKGLTLKTLHKLSNPFKSMSLIDPLPDAPPNEKPYMWSLFRDSVKVRSLAPALALLPEKQRARYKKHLKTQFHPVWQPEAIWLNWHEALKALKPN